MVAGAAAAVYPSGTGNASVTAKGIRIFPGWPLPNQIDTDLAAGVSCVSVYPTSVERVTSRFPKDWQSLEVGSTTLTLTVTGTNVTVGGTISAPQNAALLVNGRGYLYALSDTDNLATVATGLAALVDVDVSASSSGSVISISGASELIARVGVLGSSIRELKRQERGIEVIIWAPSHTDRETIADAIEVKFSKQDFLSLADGSAGRVLYRNSPVTDDFSRAGTFRKDLNYSVDFPTTEVRTDAQILEIDLSVKSQQSNAVLIAFTV